MTPTVTVVADCPTCGGALRMVAASVHPTHGVASLACCGCDACWSVELLLRPIETAEQAHTRARDRARWHRRQKGER